jgi:hypothetical protein
MGIGGLGLDLGSGDWREGERERGRGREAFGVLGGDDGCGVWLMRAHAACQRRHLRAIYCEALACALRLGLHEPNPASVVLFAAAS